jgi:hypothetical protein
MALVIVCGSILLLFLSYKYFIYPVLFSPLSNIPNAHFTSPFSNGWILWQRFCRKENKAIHAAHERLGPVVRLGSTEFSVNNVEGVRTTYGGDFEKDEWYSQFQNYGLVETRPVQNFSHIRTECRICFQCLTEGPTIIGNVCCPIYSIRRRFMPPSTSLRYPTVFFTSVFCRSLRQLQRARSRSICSNTV